MKIKEGFIVREVAGTYIAVATGEQSKKFNSMITINETGKFLFEELQKGCSKEELIEKMLAEYSVDKSIASNDVENFIKKLLEAGILDE